MTNGKRGFLFLLAALVLSAGLAGCTKTAYRGMPQQVRLYPHENYTRPGYNEDGFDRSKMNCSGGDRLRGWC